MNIKIYQINMDRDHNRLAFQGFDCLKRFQGSSEIESEIYDIVFKGEVNCNNLEDVYRMFNLHHPSGYTGRSLSVSDVVEVIDENGKSAFYFCDIIGFQKVDFEPELAAELKEEKIKVVLCEPDKLARITEIDNSLEGLQKAVQGSIEAFYPFEEPVCIICNEEGKFNGMTPNRAVYGDNNEIIDVIFGPFIICDCSKGEHLSSLSEKQLKQFMEQFKYPERLININGKLMSIRYSP